MTALIFLYGTLIPGREPPGMTATVARLRRVGQARVKGRLLDLGAYPGAVLDDSSGALIPGEVFEIPPDVDVLTAFDRYEGFDPMDPARSLFRRIKHAVTLLDGREVECWLYVYNRDPAPP